MKTYWKIKHAAGDYVDAAGGRFDLSGAEAGAVCFAPEFHDYVRAEDLSGALAALSLSVYRESGASSSAEFAAACGQFRAVCARIAAFIEAEDFQGGFDEYAAFVESEAYRNDPAAGNTLAVAWIGANELGKYTGARCGLGQPGWWYRCWEENSSNL